MRALTNQIADIFSPNDKYSKHTSIYTRLLYMLPLKCKIQLLYKIPRYYIY